MDAPEPPGPSRPDGVVAWTCQPRVAALAFVFGHGVVLATCAPTCWRRRCPDTATGRRAKLARCAAPRFDADALHPPVGDVGDDRGVQVRRVPSANSTF